MISKDANRPAYNQTSMDGYDTQEFISNDRKTSYGAEQCVMHIRLTTYINHSPTYATAGEHIRACRQSHANERNCAQLHARRHRTESPTHDKPAQKRGKKSHRRGGWSEKRGHKDILGLVSRRWKDVNSGAFPQLEVLFFIHSHG